MKEEKNIHSGHRERLTASAMTSFDGLSEVQKVELFLFYVLPRVDTNPLAHKLLDKFGNFANILDADEKELAKIDGLGKNSAAKIKILHKFFEHYGQSKIKNTKLDLKQKENFYDALEVLLATSQTEILYIFAIDNNLCVTQYRKFERNDIKAVGIDTFALYDFVCSAKPMFLAVAHNHPGGTARASQDDHDAAKYIESLLANWDCEFLDSFIVGSDGIYSEYNEGFVRKKNSKIWVVK